ncbi:MAG: hypothetical protein WB630_09950 [Candidatus Acidiferrales bacterium]
MFIEKSDTVRVGREGATRYQFVRMFIALVFAAMIYPQQTHAQLIGTMEADIPFQFHAGNTRLPAGKYFIRMLDDSNLTLIEISKPDGSVAVLLQVRETDANSTPPKSELVFNKYGKNYFLEKLFDEGQSSGSQVLESSYEKRLGRAAAEGQEHVPAHRAQPQSGN